MRGSGAVRGLHLSDLHLHADVRWQRRLAAAALASSVLFATAACVRQVSGPERQAIESRYIAWYLALADKRHAEAYDVMSPTYRAEHTLEEFVDRFSHEGSGWRRLSPKCLVRKEGSLAYLFPNEYRWMELSSGPEYELEVIDGEWFLTGETLWYRD